MNSDQSQLTRSRTAGPEPQRSNSQFAPEVIIVGGGATGCGLARDLAQRGVGVLLLEMHDLAYGATGRCHGLLHSGVRYAVSDPVAARECIAENRIVQRIAPHCTEPTGGLSIALPGDDPAYYDQLRRGCDAAGIECEPVTAAETLALEPFLNPRVVRALTVPDASVDPFLLSQENARAAARDGAEIRTHSRAIDFLRDGRRIVGLRFADREGEHEARAPITVLAAGGWTKSLAALAGVEVNLALSKGSLIIANRRFCDRVINRCRKSGDGDLLIPNGPTSIIGTTSIPAPSADGLRIEEDELRLMFAQGEQMVPGFEEARALRTYSGVRPLYRETGGAPDGRAISRGFFVLDHAARDDVPGLLSIVGGKLTTYRLMAEKTADKACALLGVKAECRTATTPLWSAAAPDHYRRHERLALLEGSAPGAMICECEMVERGAIEKILPELRGRPDLADVQHRTRLGMGPCQGGMCAARALAILHENGLLRPGESAPVLRRFLEQRFAGIAPVLWGDQLREEALNYALYATLFGLDRDHCGLPIADCGLQAAPFAAAPDRTSPAQSTPRPAPAEIRNPKSEIHNARVLVIGGGLAGMTAALAAARAGARVTLAGVGQGVHHLFSGCIDLLAYPPGADEPAANPLAAAAALAGTRPAHPYAIVGEPQIRRALGQFVADMAANGLVYLGDGESTRRVLTALGTIRLTGLAPATMAGAPEQIGAVCNINSCQNFAAELLAGELAARIGKPVAALHFRNGARRFDVLGVSRRFGEPDFVAAFIAYLRERAPGQTVAIPALLGTDDAPALKAQIEAGFGGVLCEVPGQPPSLPGLRLFGALRRLLLDAGVTIANGAKAIAPVENGGALAGAILLVGEATREEPADAVVLAGGNLVSGGIVGARDGLCEPIFGLPLAPPTPRPYFSEQFLSPGGHPALRSGIATDERLRPLAGDRLRWPNLFACGDILTGFDPYRERSGGGVALATGDLAGRLAAEAVS